ncbi:MAG TPA: sulfite exporter TauE/SafE family protein [Bryobacteraceae bacterium]|nr:sulfite exporter TauE/SafE family protein [Bryobacteraceae bacterium]
MTNVLFSTLVFAGSLVAGFLGSLTGLGGGVVIVPLLTIAFGVDIRYAIGASLVSVIATSSGAASAYVREGFSNVRVGMLLEIATASGALAGAAAAAFVPTAGLAILLGVVLLFSAFAPAHKEDMKPKAAPDPDSLGARLRLDSSYPGPGGMVAYTVRRLPLGFGMMGVAGMLSGLLGIGSGAVKVLAMDLAMGLPFKVSTTTSNFMIGVTAAASAGVYLHRGYIAPGLAMPVTLGVVVGSLAGAKVLASAGSAQLRILFRVVILALGVEMIYNGWAGRI